MSENQNRGTVDFSKYDAMTTEELQEILRLDALAPEGQESDTETLLYIMEVLTKRRKQNDNTGNTAREAFESFKKNYLPCDEDEVEPEAEEKPAKKPKRWMRGLTAAAAAVLILVCTTVTARAFGYDIWQVVATWARETFHFAAQGQTEISEPSPSNDVEYASLQEALEDFGIYEKLAPTWIPEGFELVDIKVDETPIQKNYIAYYNNGEQSFRILICSHLNSDPDRIEKSEDFVEICQVSGIDYYIFSNNSQSQSVWIYENYECNISGEITVDQLKLMIDSIGKG